MRLRPKQFARFLGVVVMAALVAGGAAAADTIQLEINKGEMVKLDSPIASVVIADPATADVQVVSPRLLFIHGKKVGETSVLAVDAQDNTVYNATVEVTHNISKLEKTVREVAPDADVSFRTVDGGLVMEGFASDSAEAERINNIASSFIGEKEKMVNMLSSAGSDQVMLQVKIVEMERSNVKRLGINLQSVVNPGTIALQLLQGQGIALDDDGILDRVGTSNIDSTTDPSIYANWQNHSGTSVSGVIDALETQGLATILAEPSLTTTSGKAANFLAGGEFPIPVRDGNDNITIQYKPFGVKLDFTPVVMGKDRMSITVAPEVSSINFDTPVEIDGITNPIILTRKASATVELGSGSTFALAGLLKSEETNSIDRFPGLGELPVLGALFRSQSFRNDKTELVILVTPYIVHPVAQQKKMMTPRDGFQPPSDLDRLITGGLYRQQPMDRGKESAPAPHADSANEPAPVLHGEGGFILE